MTRSTAMLVVLLLGVATSHAALNEPERRVRLGTCGTEHCVWCNDQSDAFCPATGATIDHDAVCNVDRTCDVGPLCALDVPGPSLDGELVMRVDDAPCGAATGACDHGNGSVTKLAFCGKRADNSTFNIATAKIDCCRRPTGPSGNVACGAVADSCFPRGNPFLCDQNHQNCTSDLSSCCLTEDGIPDPSWLGLQIFTPTMQAALQSVVPGSGLPVINSASSLSFDDHSADGLPTVRHYAVNASFVSPPADFSTTFPDCQLTVGGTPLLDATCDFCGDGELDPGEQCDDGPATGTPASCCDASCAIKPGCSTQIGGKLLLVKDNADPTKRKIVFVSKDPAIDTTVGTGVDPVTNGASFQVYNANGSGESVCLPLPSTAGTWEASGRAPDLRYSYKDADAAHGPCKVVKIKDGKLLRVLCLAKVQPIDYSLDEPTQGAMAVRFTSGATTYCATFGGDVKVDSGTDPPNPKGAGKFKAKDAAAAPCPPAPACP